jgi:hypothetical protein
MTAQRLQWHQPQIVDLGLHVRPKNNTWPTFFNIIGKHFASHQTFPKVHPGVRIVSKKTIDGKLRSRDAREPINENSRQDPVCCHGLYLHKSTIDAFLDDMEPEQVHDLNQLIGKERDKRIDLLLAGLLEYVVKNDKTGIAQRAAHQHKDRLARKIKRNALRKR